MHWKAWWVFVCPPLICLFFMDMQQRYEKGWKSV
jgi:hypothetical protein